MLNRIEPGLPVQAVKTYQIDAPLATHWRRASCDEVKCSAQANGWVTLVDERDAGQIAVDLELELLPPEEQTRAHIRRIQGLADRRAQRAYYIRHLSGRAFTERVDETGVTVFEFEPGQECFDEHKIRIDRPEIFIARGGDYRGNPSREVKVHQRPDDWVEDFAEHQETIATTIERG